jgi:large subunit ribosomal protein L10
VSNLKKETEVKALEEKFRAAKSAILTDFRGLSVAEMTALRNLLRKSNIEYRVIKNRLARIAIQNTSLADLDSLLSGPNGISLGYDDPVTASKLLSQFVRSTSNLDIKGGVIEGKLYKKKEILAIAELPPREVLISRVVGGIASPLNGFVQVLCGPIRQLMGTLEALRARKGKGN